MVPRSRSQGRPFMPWADSSFPGRTTHALGGQLIPGRAPVAPSEQAPGRAACSLGPRSLPEALPSTAAPSHPKGPSFLGPSLSPTSPGLRVDGSASAGPTVSRVPSPLSPGEVQGTRVGSRSPPLTQAASRIPHRRRDVARFRGRVRSGEPPAGGLRPGKPLRLETLELLGHGPVDDLGQVGVGHRGAHVHWRRRPYRSHQRALAPPRARESSPVIACEGARGGPPARNTL
jgi:hypothetical protein